MSPSLSVRLPSVIGRHRLCIVLSMHRFSDFLVLGTEEHMYAALQVQVSKG